MTPEPFLKGSKAVASQSPGDRLRASVRQGIQPMIGIYDTFSASLAGRDFPGLFLSGFGFAASYYGMPDIGLIAWPDMLGLAERIRAVLPNHHLLVDIDDGYGDPDNAVHVVCRLEKAGASGIILEDQQRPRRCGHYEGKQIMELSPFLDKLERVLAARRDLFVVARTDAQEPEEVLARAKAFANAGADAVLVEAIRDLQSFRQISQQISVPLVCNQIAGGKTPAWSLSELRDAGAGLVVYSTPCLFAAQAAMEIALRNLKRDDGRLTLDPEATELCRCTAVLKENFQRALQP